MLRTNLAAMRDNLEQYATDQGHYPAELEDLVAEGYLRAVPLDPIADSDSAWEVTRNARGEVVDVHSGSGETAPTGEPYASW